MAITHVAGAVTEFSTNGTSPPNLAIPAAVTLAVDDVVVVEITGQSTGETADFTNDRGLTRVGAAFAASSSTIRILGTWAVKVDAGNIASFAGGVQFTRSGAGTRLTGRLLVLRGVDPTTMIDVASAAANTTGTNSASATGATVTAAGGLELAHYGSNWSAGQDSAVSAVPSGSTIVGTAKQNPDPGSSAVSRTQSVAYARTVTAGATGTRTVTWVGTPAQRAGELVIFRAAADPPAPPDPPNHGNLRLRQVIAGIVQPGIVRVRNRIAGVTQPGGAELHYTPQAWTIDLWRAADTHPAIAHRFAPAYRTRSEFEYVSGDGAVAAGFHALEVSCWPAVDDWMVCHDNSTADQYLGTAIDITSSANAALQALTRRYGTSGEPMHTLAETLARYPNQVLFVENKGYAFSDGTKWGEFLDILEAADPTHTRIVFKATGNSTTVMQLAKDRGFTTWGYYFGDAGAINAATHYATGAIDWVGFSMGSLGDTSPTYWDWAATNSIPVIGHVVRSTPTSDPWAPMETAGAEMGMVNDPALHPL